MATFKLDVTKRYGKFFYKFSPAGSVPKESDGHDGLAELLDALRPEFKENVASHQGSVIFRGMAYSKFSDLAAVVRGARY